MFVEPPDDEENLQRFCSNLHKFTRFLSFQELATLTYGDATKGIDKRSNCCVSSLDFDRDGAYFAVAGMTSKIKVCIVCSRIYGCVHV